MKRPSIVCVSANPSIDRRLRFERLALGRVQRAKSAENFPGGKSAHVAMATRALGARPLWLGFLGGSTGAEFQAGFRTLGIEMSAVRTRKRMRMNLELLEASGRITEMLEPGEAPGVAELRAMARRLRDILCGTRRGAIVVVSGSLPAGVPTNFYRSLIFAARSTGSRVFLDTSGDALRGGIAARPSFVKPNLEEAEALLAKKLRSLSAVVRATWALAARGAESVAISLGAKGLVWLEWPGGPVWLARPPALKCISSVGSGDATIAGFAFAAANGLTGEEAARLAVACGAANCLATAPGQISAKNVQTLKRRVVVRRLD